MADRSILGRRHRSLMQVEFAVPALSWKTACGPCVTFSATSRPSARQLPVLLTATAGTRAGLSRRGPGDVPEWHSRSTTASCSPVVTMASTPALGTGVPRSALDSAAAGGSTSLHGLTRESAPRRCRRLFVVPPSCSDGELPDPRCSGRLVTPGTHSPGMFVDCAIMYWSTSLATIGAEIAATCDDVDFDPSATRA